jgi:hypothetical protein
MSGQIINPFSSDFKTPSSVYATESIPVAAYALIGITSLTLAYVTLIESTQGDITGPKSPSATSMLPAMSSPLSYFSTKPTSPSMQVSPSPAPSPSPVPASAQPVTPIAEAVPIAEGKPAVGGKTKRKKNKNKNKNKTVHKK